VKHFPHSNVKLSYHDSHNKINLTLGLEEMLVLETLKSTNPGTRCATYRLQTNKWDSFYCLQGIDDSPLTGSQANFGYAQKTGKNNNLKSAFDIQVTVYRGKFL